MEQVEGNNLKRLIKNGNINNQEDYYGNHRTNEAQSAVGVDIRGITFYPQKLLGSLSK